MNDSSKNDKNMNFSIYITKKQLKNISGVINDNSRNIWSSQELYDFLEEKLEKIYPKTSQEWVDSDKIIKCENCSSMFSFFYRKHHCRACGHIFCRNCCYKYIKIPHDLIEVPKEKTEIYHYIKSITRVLNNIVYSNETSLVCNDCYNKISNLLDIRTTIQIFKFLTLPELYTVILVNKKWYNAAIHSLSKFRNIQYKSILSEEDYRLILGNKDYLYGHSIWNKILLKSYITLNIRDNLILTKGLPKRYDCWNIMCSRKCNNELNFIDVIDILYHYVNSSNKSDIRENLFYELLWRVLKDVITYNTLYCIFPYLITCLKLIKIDRDYEIFIYNILCIIGESILGTPMFDPFLTLLMFEYNYIFTGINYKDTESTNTLKFLNIINIYLKKTIGDIRETNKVDSYIQKIKDTINIFVDIYDKKGSYNLEKKGEWI